ncbi:energy transducer TonB [Novosphingobium sp. BL-52-GroH]|uniref:energy transducer TonB family protein n=1 Tax=Novosphingobium sp. BL-52-GroH TaxID=3349877 RepID=UPI0038514563
MKHLPVARPPHPHIAAEVELPSRYGVGTGSRLFGVAGTCVVPMLVLGALLLSWETYNGPPKPPTLSVYDVALPAAPPAPRPEAPAEPEPEQEPLDEPVVVDQPAIAPPLLTLPQTRPVAVITPPSPPPPDVQARPKPQPESQPTAAAPEPSNAKPTWEGAVLSALNTVKRYPREARFARQQGVPYIRFVMDREGTILSVRLERPSGVRSLDQEALALPRRAQPLSAPPAEVKGATIELVVPVEFFMR